MKFKNMFLLLIAIVISQNSFGQNDSLRINKNRVFIVGGSLAIGLSASYWYVGNSWWSEKQIPFHFDDGADLTYALNVDKFGHFMGGVLSADIFSSSMKWSGIEGEKALWYGAAFGSGLQLAIEMKDAYAPYWGFSKWDLVLGSAGALWPVVQHYNNHLKGINFKFSYYKHSDIYWELDRQRGKELSKYAWQDDYPNQTYWATFDISHFTGNSFLPEWLNLAIGFGLDDSQHLENGRKMGGHNEWYIALDYDIPKLFKNWNSPIAKELKYWLNYIHFPAPTIRISPKLEFYPLFI